MTSSFVSRSLPVHLARGVIGFLSRGRLRHSCDGDRCRLVSGTP